MSTTMSLRDEDIETRHHAGSVVAEPRLGDDADGTDATDDADGTDATDDADDADATDDATDGTDAADADGTDR